MRGARTLEQAGVRGVVGEAEGARTRRREVRTRAQAPEERTRGRAGRSWAVELAGPAEALVAPALGWPRARARRTPWLGARTQVQGPLGVRTRVQVPAEVRTPARVQAGAAGVLGVAVGLRAGRTLVPGPPGAARGRTGRPG